jgi:hypothetical protein
LSTLSFPLSDTPITTNSPIDNSFTIDYLHQILSCNLNLISIGQPGRQRNEDIGCQEIFKITVHLYYPIVAKYPRDCFQMDIMVYNRFEYDGYKYILAFIDVFSRYAQAQHLNVDQELWKNKPTPSILWS